MKSVINYVPIMAYVDDEEQPCCAKNFNNNEYCIFYRTAMFGSRELCALGDEGDAIIHRRKEGIGTLIPHKNCIVWPK